MVRPHDDESSRGSSAPTEDRGAVAEGGSFSQVGVLDFELVTLYLSQDPGAGYGEGERGGSLKGRNRGYDGYTSGGSGGRHSGGSGGHHSGGSGGHHSGGSGGQRSTSSRVVTQVRKYDDDHGQNNICREGEVLESQGDLIIQEKVKEGW